jgi:hypothetical protein
VRKVIEDASSQQPGNRVSRRGLLLRLSTASALSVTGVSFAAALLGSTGEVAAAHHPVAGATPTATATVTPTGAVSAGGGGMAGRPLAGATPTATATTTTATVTPTGAVSAGGGGTAGTGGSGGTALLSVVTAGLLTAGGIVVARRRRAMNE